MTEQSDRPYISLIPSSAGFAAYLAETPEAQGEGED